MADIRAARRYASALFDTALKHNVVKNVESDLDAIGAFMESDDRFRKVMLSPEFGRDNKISLCEKLFADRTTALTMQALRLIVHKRREEEILAIRDEYAVLRRQQEGVAFAKVTSSEELSKDQREEIVARLRLATGKKVEATFDIDPSLIGGIRAAIGNIVLDGSLRGGLNTLRNRLYHDLLKQI
jgi:F-type H+-transporting ATPase subunit delta